MRDARLSHLTIGITTAIATAGLLDIADIVTTDAAQRIRIERTVFGDKAIDADPVQTKWLRAPAI